MFDKDFYPTPDKVIEIMISDFKKTVEGITFYDLGSVLEPHAGKGNIVDYLVDNNISSKRDISVIEKNLELSMILMQKNYKFIDYDFLTHFSVVDYDTILMNPPFSSCEDHLLKALEFNCTLRCIYPKTALDNLYSSKRKLIKDKLNILNSKIVDLGSVFEDSERKTSVEVVLIKVDIPKVEKNQFKIDTDYMDRDSYTDFQHMENQLEKTDYIESLEDLYKGLSNTVKELHSNLDKIQYYQQLLGCKIVDETLSDSLRYNKLKNEGNLNQYSGDLVNNSLNRVKKEMWSSLFDKINISESLTSNIKVKFLSNMLKVSNLSFNKNNIEFVLKQVFYNRLEIFNDCIKDTFDMFTQYFDGNKSHSKGWKTNSNYKLNNKIIIPDLTYRASSTLDYLMVVDGKHYILEDLDKCMCFLSNKDYKTLGRKSLRSVISTTNYENVPSQRRHEYTGEIINYVWKKPIHLKFGEWYDTEFFEIKGFKSGTLHIKVKDLELWKKFNLIGSGQRNMVGNDVKTRKTKTANAI